MKKIWSFDDESKWGSNLKLAGARSGIHVNLFFRVGDIMPDSVDVAFVRMCQIRERRKQCRDMVFALNKLGIKTVPTVEDALRYDDKIYQHKWLKDWLPETRIFTTHESTQSFLNSNQCFEYPFISKSREGASSSAVRLINNESDAQNEIDLVFKWANGMGTGSYDRKQKDYIYWQEFIPDNTHDIRVCKIGNCYFGLIRQNRPDVPMASGSGNNLPFYDLTNDHVVRAMHLAWEISSHLKTKLACYDFVFKNGRPYVLEVSSSWSPNSYATCPVWVAEENTMGGRWFRKARGLNGGFMFDMIVALLNDVNYSESVAI
jgi:glutathione synthase/RimK-type ligase-like ATP-grasp enzyme